MKNFFTRCAYEVHDKYVDEIYIYIYIEKEVTEEKRGRRHSFFIDYLCALYIWLKIFMVRRVRKVWNDAKEGYIFGQNEELINRIEFCNKWMDNVSIVSSLPPSPSPSSSVFVFFAKYLSHFVLFVLLLYVQCFKHTKLFVIILSLICL